MTKNIKLVAIGCFVFLAAGSASATVVDLNYDGLISGRYVYSQFAPGYVPIPDPNVSGIQLQSPFQLAIHYDTSLLIHSTQIWTNSWTNSMSGQTYNEQSVSDYYQAPTQFLPFSGPSQPSAWITIDVGGNHFTSNGQFVISTFNNSGGPGGTSGSIHVSGNFNSYKPNIPSLQLGFSIMQMPIFPTPQNPTPPPAFSGPFSIDDLPNLIPGDEPSLRFGMSLSDLSQNIYGVITNGPSNGVPTPATLSLVLLGLVSLSLRRNVKRDASI
jgi:hypothetical protein